MNHIWVDYISNNLLLTMEQIRQLPFADQVKVFRTEFGMWQGNVRAAVHELGTFEYICPGALGRDSFEFVDSTHKRPDRFSIPPAGRTPLSTRRLCGARATMKPVRSAGVPSPGTIPAARAALRLVPA
jgi:hypothetical protein